MFDWSQTPVHVPNFDNVRIVVCKSFVLKALPCHKLLRCVRAPLRLPFPALIPASKRAFDVPTSFNTTTSSPSIRVRSIDRSPEDGRGLHFEGLQSSKVVYLSYPKCCFAAHFDALSPRVYRHRLWTLSKHHRHPRH
jgi:hypothetical protein